MKGFTLKEKLREGQHFVVSRAVRDADDLSVVLKILKSPYPTPAEMVMIYQEQELLAYLVDENVIGCHGVEMDEGRPVLVLEDFGGVSLGEVIRSKQNLSLERVLEICLKLARSVRHIHGKGVIHRDLKPDNILLGPDGATLKVADFGISTRLQRETASKELVKRLQGTLAYISPEQTGRMNRPVDYRSDYYSLGVIFYELATGSRPFQAATPIELIHAHIAVRPRTPSELKPEVPAVLDEIILKLLAKDAEERYQSTEGIVADLEECRRRLDAGGRIEPFPIGSKDFSRNFQIPRKLYGRDQEIRKLYRAFEKARQGSCEAVMVSGFSGIGKSSIVNEIDRFSAEHNGIFLAGKFDQFKRHIPYSALTFAFQQWVRGILADKDEVIFAWREKLLAVLGANAGLIVDVIPEVELVIGAQPPVPDLESADAQLRFNTVLRGFALAFADPGHPLILFLDDLQWADRPTLSFLTDLLDDVAARHILLIGAYRDNEVDTSHPLAGTLGELRRNDARFVEIHLLPLQDHFLQELIADTVDAAPEDVIEIADIVRGKTNGNPFFVIQFLHAVYNRELLQFNAREKRWEWDVAGIRSMEITDNVLDFMTERIRTLPEQVQNLLRLASCLGNKFSLAGLSAIAELEPPQALRGLAAALNEGLVQAIGDGNVASGSTDAQGLQFLHDRVQQASYNLLEPVRRQEIHLRIGRMLVAEASPEKQEDRVFEIVGQLNEGRDLITDEAELDRLALLNLKAGHKAKQATAYESAIGYLKQSLLLQGKDPWALNYERAFRSYRDLAESEYLRQEFEESMRLFLLILEHARHDVDRVEIYALMITQHINTAARPEGVQAGRTALGLLGIDLPQGDAMEAALAAEQAGIGKHLESLKVSDLLDAPQSEDAALLLTLNILINLWVIGYQMPDFGLLAWTVSRGMNLCLERGNCEYAPAIYILFAVGASFQRNYGLAHEFGRVSVDLARRLDARRFMSLVLNQYGCFVAPFSDPPESTTEYFKEAYFAGIENGAALIASFAAGNVPMSMFLNADFLPDIVDVARTYIPFLERQQNVHALKLLLSVRNLSLSLQGRTPRPFSLVTEDFDEEQYARELATPENLMWSGWNLTVRLPLQFYAGDYKAAFNNARTGHEMGLRNIIGGHFQVIDYLFYGGLSVARYHDRADESERTLCLTILKENLAAFQEWCEKCHPRLFLPRAALLEAELARIEGGENFEELFEQAIAVSRRERIVHCEALANLSAGRFYAARNRFRAARGYLMDASDLFDRWGAGAVARKLRAEYGSEFFAPRPSDVAPALRGSITLSGSVDPSGSSTVDSTESTVLDLDSFVRASEALAREIHLEKLLRQLMTIVLQSAGAMRGVLLLVEEGRFLIQADFDTENKSEEVLQGIPVEGSDRVPAGIINYVIRTREVVTGESARANKKISEDTYLQKHRPRSLLCLPLLHQGKLKGLIYLEHRDAAGAFTAERFNMIGLLSAQIAISLENALLYREMENNLEIRTRQLVDAEKMAYLGRLVAGVAHEANTPIGITITGASTLRDETLRIQNLKSPTSEEIEDYLGMAAESSRLILANAARAGDLITNFKQVAVDQHRQDLRNLKIVSYLNEIISGLSPLTKVKGHRIELSGEDHGLITYPGALAQIVTNLVRNTLDHGYPEGGGGTSRITVTREGSLIKLEYGDDGRGIPADIMPRVFEPFFSTNEAGGGTGLGMHIVYNLVTQVLRGTVELGAAAGGGLLCTLNFPARLTEF